MSTSLGMPGLGRPPVPAAGCDCSVCPFYLRNAAAVEPLCSGSNSDCRYCGCARAGAPAGGCTQCPIRCGSRTDIAAWMTDIGGTFTFDDIDIPGALPAGLPRFIPQVDGSGTAQLHAVAQWPAYALGLRRVLSPASHRLYPRMRAAVEAGHSAGQALGLPVDAAGRRPLTVLLGYGEDPLVEAFWTRRHTDGLLADLAALRFDVVLAPNASMYGSQPRAEMLLNFRRNLLMAAEAAQAGAVAVPNIYWFRLEDLERYLDWLDEHPVGGPPAIAVNLQTFRTEEDWQAMALPGLSLLAAAIPARLPVIITGPSRPDRISQLIGLFGDRLTLISQNPAQYAQHGALMTAEGRMDVKASRADLFARNTRFLAGLLE